jgi:hypothetical protein
MNMKRKRERKLLRSDLLINEQIPPAEQICD